MAVHRLKPKDKQLLEVGGNRQIGLPGYDWPPFLSGTPGVHDYIECHIYDAGGTNLIESFITKDYIVEGNNVIVKPGNDLRSKGYVRGKYQVNYNFLREEFGTDETILVYAHNNEVYTGAKRLYPDNADLPWYIDDDNLIYSGVKGEEVERRKELLIKNNSAWIHKISEDRREIRLVPNNIDSDRFKESFNSLRKTIKHWGTKNLNVDMTFPDGFGGKKIRLQGLPRSKQFTKKSVGGEFIFDRGYITHIERRIYEEPRLPLVKHPGVVPGAILDEIPAPNEPLIPYERQAIPVVNKVVPKYKPSSTGPDEYDFVTSIIGSGG